ncbi:MAG: DUF4352 domain-containing protein [Frankiaceae bacterium]|nr:DUF4352 domain-containing protein [Frankiaceae bacterium]
MAAVVTGGVLLAKGGSPSPKKSDAAKSGAPATTSRAPSPTPSDTPTCAASDSSCTTTPAGSGTPAKSSSGGAKIGAPTAIAIDGAEGTLTVNSVSDSQGDKYFPPDNGKYIVVNLTIAGTKGTLSGAAASFDFELQLDTGQVVQTAIFGPGDPLHSTDLDPGQNTTGDIAFDVAADRSASALLYTPGYGAKRITIPLS